MVRDAISIEQLWLPWFVHRAEPARPVVGPLQPQLDIAQQVRIRDVATPQVWEALGQPDPNNPDAQIHTVGIEAQTERFAGATVVAILPVRPVAGGWVLLDGCHRACALHRLDPAAKADLIELPFVVGPAYDPRPRAAELRRTYPSTRRRQ